MIFKSLILFGIYAGSGHFLFGGIRKKDCPFADSLLPQSLIE